MIGAGGYEIASHAGGPATTPASSSAAVPSAAASQAIGAPVNYGHGDFARSIPTVTSTTNFVPSRLGAQAAAALEAARLEGVHTAKPVHHQLGLGSASNGTALHSLANTAGLSGQALAGCVGRFAAPGHAVQLVEDAKFSGKPATIIITTAPSGRSAEVWVVGESCSASHSDLLDHLKVAHI